MHLPLIDIPKPKRSARPRCASACVLFAFWLAAFSPWLHRPSAPPVVELPVTATEASPVKWITVVKVTQMKGLSLSGDQLFSETLCQMPLMELYDELCAVEVEARHHAGTYQGAELFSFQADEEFAHKYGLTLKQVEEIKWEGSRLKYGTER